MPRRKPTEPVTVTTVHPEVWTDALRQAGGDAGRIEIISETSVVVHNRSGWRSAKPGRSTVQPPRSIQPAESAESTQSTQQTQPARSVPPADKPSKATTKERDKPAKPAPAETPRDEVKDEPGQTEPRPARPATQPFDTATPPVDSAKPTPGPTVPVAAFVPPRLHSDS